MKKPIGMLLLIFVGVALIGFVLTPNGCMTKVFGGTMEVNLPPGQKLVTCSWSVWDLWYLTKPMNSWDKAERYEFREKSWLGLCEGTVVIIEHRAEIEE
jgi:hypothetical protein